MTISVAIETITPEIAQQMLDLNDHNRVVSQGYVDQYYNDLMKDRWPVNGETVKICEDGRLLDGQHRLLAIVKAQKTVTTIVVRGLPLSAQDTIDIGRKRAVRDALSIGGYKNSTAVASMAGYIVRWKKYQSVFNFRFGRVSNSEILAYIDNNPEIVASAAHTSNKSRGSPMIASIDGVIHFAMNNRLNLGEEYEAFRTVMRTGIQTYEGDPAFHLREKILKQRLQRVPSRPGDQLATALYIFDKFVDRVPCTKIYAQDVIAFRNFDPEAL